MIPDLYVVPCGAVKLPHAGFARDLYVSPHFRFTLDNAVRAAGDPRAVRILSALHGLVPLAQWVEPYDVTMTDAGSVSAGRLAIQLGQLVALHDVERIHTLLPRAYLARLVDALGALPPSGVELFDHYAGARGIGDQRRRAAQLAGAPVPA